MTIFLSIVLVVHAMVHLMGFLKAFDLADIKDLKIPISRSMGVLWLFCTVIFIITAILVYTDNYWWLILGVVGIVTSQILIATSWQDSKFGSLVNILLLILITVEFGSWSMQQDFLTDVEEGMTTLEEETLLTESDMAHLPQPVQDYLHYAGVVGKPKVQNVMIEFDGQMRQKGEPWFEFTSVQYNFFHDYRRLFFIEADVNHVPTIGYHLYGNDTARMVMKVLSYYPVVDVSGDQLFRAETVTIFNDMCLLAPATLINKRIRWQTISENTVKAIFENDAVEISAVLEFNDKNQLINFTSEDRFALAENGMLNYTFSTPVKEYNNINDYNLPTKAEAIWHYPEGKFVYGKFNLKNIEYNVRN